MTRFDYRTKGDVIRAVDRCAQLGFDTVLFQVRGNATVFYPSDLEPWAEQLGWSDPGFDPLRVALDRAHQLGLQLHAWVNVMPAWWGTSPPESAEHLYYKRPEWFWFDQHGRRQPLCERFYVSLNPCLPAVRAHLVSVMTDLVARYDVDGLHLDYLRFPNEPPAIAAGSDSDYPRDPGTLKLFRRDVGDPQRDPERDPKAWDGWRCDQVTRLLAEIRRAVKRRAPQLVLSAAVGSDPERALEHFQDVRTWLERDLLDAVFPMNYTADAALFEERLSAWRELVPRGDATHLVMGTMVAQGEPAARAAQVRRAADACGAVAVFAYSGLFDSSDDTLAAQDAAAREERSRRRAVIEAAMVRGE